MKLTKKPEQPLREALIEAMIAYPRTLPSVDQIDLTQFWSRFDKVAPAHLRLGFATATVVIGVVVPALMGYRSSFSGLDRNSRDAVLQRATELPFGPDLVELVKIVACLGYFSDAGVQSLVRGRRT